MFFAERLRADHETARFACGTASLDEWLQRAALNSDGSGNTTTWVWLDHGGAVCAYYALTPGWLARGEAPKRVSRGSLSTISGTLVAKLALAEHLQGLGHGGVLLIDAVSIAIEAMRIAGGRVVIVDAIDERASSFYQHFGFIPLPGTPSRLVIKASDAAKSLGIEWS